jgi:hypothetical protein
MDWKIWKKTNNTVYLIRFDLTLLNYSLWQWKLKKIIPSVASLENEIDNMFECAMNASKKFETMPLLALPLSEGDGERVSHYGYGVLIMSRWKGGRGTRENTFHICPGPWIHPLILSPLLSHSLFFGCMRDLFFDTLIHKVLTYVEYRAVSDVLQNIDPPPPSPPASVSSPPPTTKGGGYTLAGRWGGWGVNIL